MAQRGRRLHRQLNQVLDPERDPWDRLMLLRELTFALQTEEARLVNEVLPQQPSLRLLRYAPENLPPYQRRPRNRYERKWRRPRFVPDESEGGPIA